MMNRKESLYAVIGGCVGAVLTMVLCSFLPLGVQSQSGNFGEIICTGMRVVDSQGKTKINIGSITHGGYVIVSGKEQMQVLISTTENGGGIAVYGKTGETKVAIGATEQGGRVSVDDSDGKTNVGIDATEHGGRVVVFGKGDSKGQANMSVNEYGNGAVSTWDKNGYRQ